jgi:16S rRNA (guanine527-N7)-methyltransferase
VYARIVTSTEFRDRLDHRAGQAGISVPDEAVEALESYLRVLSKWNARINLTALPLTPPSDEALDRLLVEPLAAARSVPDGPFSWVDLGSGGGSPAIPLKIVKPALRLTMVESRTRKAAFLREAVRAIGLTDALVAEARFEDYASQPEIADTAALVTVRAVRADHVLFDVAARLLRNGGRLLMFCPTTASVSTPDFSYIETVALTNRPAYLAICERMFHVEQKR